MGLFDKVSDALSSGDSSGSDEENESVETGGVFDVPEWAVKDRVNVEKRTGIVYEHYDVTEEQARTIAQKLKEELESTEGYSQRSVRSPLEDELDIDDELLETIVWTEMASIEMLDRVNTYLDQETGGEVYKISGPDDDRTHPVTEEAIEEIEDRGGAVPMKELAEILLEKAEKYEGEGGTPERMEHWVPHERFRFSIVRHVDF
ncbi:hypothetical protein ACFQGE_10255 [Halomicroarcula sp. GCM10025817]|uniref:hypothetical protein n=1 Tax=Haloarcula TaxID=2237 RepID=UPI0023E828E4|nr:hypothetical protein [Halomicroarcula sp. SYNS111]